MATSIHSGESTHHQDQVITLHNFSTTNATKNRIATSSRHPTPELFSLLIFLILIIIIIRCKVRYTPDRRHYHSQGKHHCNNGGCQSEPVGSSVFVNVWVFSHCSQFVYSFSQRLWSIYVSGYVISMCLLSVKRRYRGMLPSARIFSPSGRRSHFFFTRSLLPTL